MEDYRLDRHLQLWDNHNKMIVRVIFLSMVLSLALIVKVLTPFVSDSEKKRPHVESIHLLKTEKKVIDEKIRLIKQIEDKLVDVDRTISARPWKDEKDKLIQRYIEMNSSPPTQGYSAKDYQKEGDQTIHNIGHLLRTEIIQPLKAITDKANTRSLGLSRLSNQVNLLHNFVKEWENRYINVNWYETRNLKNETIHKLTHDIKEQFDAYNTVVADELTIVQQAKAAVETKLVDLTNQIDQEESQLEIIEQTLDEILPSWLHGLVSIKQAIQLLPAALVGVALYVMFAGSILTRHYQIYANGKALSNSVKSEASMSSLWTLIPRGRYGTLLTTTAYVLFFLLTWSFFEKAISLLLAWISIDPTQAWIGSSTPWLGFLWLSRLLFLGLIGYVLMLSWRKQFAS